MKKIQLSVPKPCHENWEAMTPENKGRFCGSCQKVVVDFSAMSDRQLAEFFKKPAGSVCGRFHSDQLEREIELPRKRIPWVKYFFTVALPAFLVSCKFVGKQATQGKALVIEQRITGDTVVNVLPPPPPVVGELRLAPDDTATVHVVAPPFFAMGEITLPQVDTAVTKRCRLQAIAIDSMHFTKPPFQYKPLKIRAVEIDHSSQLVGVLGGVSITRVTTRSTRGEAITLATTKETALPQATSVVVYPNPIRANAPLTITTKGLQEGRYIVYVLAVNGALVQQTAEELSEERQSFQLPIKNPTSGVYFLRLQHEKTGLSFMEKIIVN